MVSRNPNPQVLGRQESWCLATKICDALGLCPLPPKIEEEIFYPAFLAATKDKDMHHEAEIEHDGAKNLIAQIEASDPSDDYFDSKVHVLSEMIKDSTSEERRTVRWDVRRGRHATMERWICRQAGTKTIDRKAGVDCMSGGGLSCPRLRCGGAGIKRALLRMLG